MLKTIYFYIKSTIFFILYWWLIWNLNIIFRRFCSEDISNMHKSLLSSFLGYQLTPVWIVINVHSSLCGDYSLIRRDRRFSFITSQKRFDHLLTQSEPLASIRLHSHRTRNFSLNAVQPLPWTFLRVDPSHYPEISRCMKMLVDLVMAWKSFESNVGREMDEREDIECLA